MRKILVLAAIFVSTLMLAGCGGGKEQSVTLTTEQLGQTIEMTLEAKGDIVHTMTQTATVALSDYIDVEDEEQVAMAIETLENETKEKQETVADIEGADLTYDYDDEQFQIVLKVDMSNSDSVEQLSDLDLLPIEGNSSKVSLEKSKEGLLEAGWTVVE